MDSQQELEYLRWDDVPVEEVNTMMSRQIITGALMTVAKIYLKDGFLVPLHQHHNEQITQVLSGRMRFRFGSDRSEERILGPGDVVVIPANLLHEAQCIGDVVEMDMWAPRREDWLDGSDSYLRDAER